MVIDGRILGHEGIGNLPTEGDEEVMVMLSDTLPIGLECGVLNGQTRDPLRDVTTR